ncbi:unnamed protein product [Prunus brigantina]
MGSHGQGGRTHDQGGGRDLPGFMGVTPPCFTIPHANLTTHLPRSDSTTQIFSASIVPPGLPLYILSSRLHSKGKSFHQYIIRPLIFKAPEHHLCYHLIHPIYHTTVAL